MKSRNSGYSSDTEQNKQQDLSVLRKPIFTALNGFIEAKKAYDNGTEEIRRLLSKECDIIYECKVCRNIFRSLTNFISHKRVYCRTTFNTIAHQFNSNSNRFIDQDISTILQAEQDYVNYSTTKDNKNNENSSKDLSSIIERLLKREQANRILKLSDFYDQVNNKLTQDEMLRKKHILQLDNVPNSNAAVYQTIKKDGSDNIKTEVTEVHDLLLNNKTVLGPDGKILEPEKSTESLPSSSFFTQNLISKQLTNENISCNICNLKFSTEKTLKLHIQTKHITSTFVYQCPSCSQTFLQPGAVIRHLSNDHKKSMRRIRLMRESIFKRRVRADEVQVKGPSRELARLQTSSEKREAENKAWMENIERDNNSPMCTYCGKSFERKAVLTTHLNNCAIKNKTTLATKRSIDNSNNSNNITGNNNGSKNDLQGHKQPISNEDKDWEIISDMNMESIDLTEIENISIKSKRKKTPKVFIKNEELDSDTLNDLFWSLESSADNKLSLKTVSIEDFTKTVETNTNNEKIEKPEKPEKPEKQEKIEKHEKEALIITKGRNNHSKDLSFYCKICKKKFDALSNLRRHISMFHYRQRKFGCKLCDYRAFRKYDVINHLGSSHSINNERGIMLDFVVIKEDGKIEKNEENIDADVIIAKNGTFDDDITSPPLVEKRRRRSKVPKALKMVNGNDIAAEKLQQKFTRSSSNLSISSNDDSLVSVTSKRPIRNRVKPVNKDFVYDLSNLLKKDMILSERDSSTTLIPAKAGKRRNTIILSDDNSREDTTNIANGDIEIKSNKLNIKGSALSMARLAVTSFRACFNKPPEIPIERPIIPGRIISTLRNENNSTINDIHSFKLLPSSSSTKELNRSKMLRRVSDDSLLRAISKKRKLEQFQTASIHLNQSLDDVAIKQSKISLNMNGEKKSSISRTIENGQTNDEEKMMIKCPTEKEFQEYLIANKLTEPVKKISLTPLEPMASSTPTIPITPSTSVKRITLMQRLAENKHKKLQESLLKSVLEN